MNKSSIKPLSLIPAYLDLACMGFFEDNQLGVLLQEKFLFEPIIKAFHAGPESYSYLEGGKTVPVSMWSFRFDAPLGLIEVNFDFKRGRPSDSEALLNGRTSQSIRLYLRMEGQMIDMTTLEIDPQAWGLFQVTLRRQKSLDYKKEDYDKTLEGIYSYASEEIVAMGQEFLVPRKPQTSILKMIPSVYSCH